MNVNRAKIKKNLTTDESIDQAFTRKLDLTLQKTGYLKIIRVKKVVNTVKNSRAT